MRGHRWRSGFARQQVPPRAGGSAGHYYLKSSILKAGDMAELHNARTEQARRSRRKLDGAQHHAPPLSIITTRSTSSTSASSTSTPPYKACTCMTCNMHMHDMHAHTRQNTALRMHILRSTTTRQNTALSRTGRAHRAS